MSKKGENINVRVDKVLKQALVVEALKRGFDDVSKLVRLILRDWVNRDK